MLEELIIFVIILGFSLFFRYLRSLGDSIRPFYGILEKLAYIGVAIHEISHYLVSLLVGIKPRYIKIKYRHEKKGYVAPHGSVLAKPRSFLQAFLISFAPLYISTWLAVLFFNIIFYSNFWWVVRLIAVFFLISTIIGAAPSGADISVFFHSVQFDPIYTLYQIFLIVISGFILWAFVFYTEIVFFLDVFYYLSIAVIYWGLKLSLMGISKIISLIQSRSKKPRKLRFRRIARRRYKPQKPHKIGIEEAPW